MNGQIAGFLSVLLAALSYGSSYVPARSFEVHDGIVFNWYQMQGMLVAGMISAMFINDWSAPAGVSFAFYVHPEGLFAGVTYQLASVFAVLAVKKVGLGIYYTVHEFSNVGATLLIGFVGPAMGFPAKAPSNVLLALLGTFLIGLGMVPTMFLEDDLPETDIAVKEPGAQMESKSAEIEGFKGPPPLKSKQPASLADVYFPIDDAEEVTDAVQASSARNLESNSLSLNALSWNALSGSKMMQANSHTWDGANVPKDIKLTLEHFHHITSSLPTLPLVVDSDEDDDQEQEDAQMFGINERQITPNTLHANSRWDKGVGLFYSLVAGGLFGVMFAPMPLWKQRMAQAGIDASSADFIFAVCVGASLFSSANLAFWSTVKTVRKQKLVKSVLRPALSAGAIYYFAMLFEFYAIEMLPYAVAYVSCTGLALAVSMSWGIFVFGEMKGNHNHLMAVLSFTGVLAGATALAVAS